MTTLSTCVLFRGGGGNSANYWGRGVKLGLRHAFSFTRLPGHVQLQQTLFTKHAIFADGIEPCRTWFLSGKTGYHLHGQTGRFTVWVNDKQNSRLVNFIPESCSSLFCTNQFHLPKNDREGLKPVSKMTLKKWTTNFRLEHSLWKKRTALSDVPLLPEIIPGMT